MTQYWLQFLTDGSQIVGAVIAVQIIACVVWWAEFGMEGW